jgi:excisionase family DNA binding protein
MPEVLTIEEAAARLKVKRDTVRDWLKAGKLKGVKLGRLWRVDAEDLERLLRGETTAEDLDDARAFNEAMAEGQPRPYEEVRRELGLS